LQAAIDAGADSVYFGVNLLNMRSRSSNNFTLNDLKEIVERCNQHNVKTYITLNTILYDQDLELMRTICDAAKKYQVSAIIACDIAVITYAQFIGQPVHISTQLNVTNIEGVRYYAQFADVIVLARELTLEQITHICRTIEEENICGPSGQPVRIEIFIHGALCVAISGKCHMSLALYHHSANRGACLQACRRRYKVTEEETGDELAIDNQYIMSPKDLCTVGFLDKLIEAGVSVLKIEGRGRSPEYVQTVVQTYRQALDSIDSGTYNQENVDQWLKELSKVYNRGFWQGGYYLGKKLGEWTGNYGSQATQRKVYLGKATNYFSKIQVAEFKLETQSVQDGDEILITGPTTGVINKTMESLRTDTSQGSAQKGDMITFPLEQKARPSDKLFLVVPA